MRKLIFLAMTFCASSTWAQSVSIGEAIEPLIPGLSVHTISESPRFVNDQDVCLLPVPPWECGPRPFVFLSNFGIDAGGYVYTLSTEITDFGNGRTGNILRRVSPAGVVEDIVHVVFDMCLAEDCSTAKVFRPTSFLLDVTGGRLLMTARASYFDPSHPEGVFIIGVAEIAGLPAIQDVIPGGPAGPAGPQGPPGTPADMTLVEALQQQVATQQAQVEALRATVNRILDLAGIGQRLQKPKATRRVDP